MLIDEAVPTRICGRGEGSFANATYRRMTDDLGSYWSVDQFPDGGWMYLPEARAIFRASATLNAEGLSPLVRTTGWSLVSRDAAAQFAASAGACTIGGRQFSQLPLCSEEEWDALASLGEYPELPIFVEAPAPEPAPGPVEYRDVVKPSIPVAIGAAVAGSVLGAAIASQGGKHA